MKAKRLLAVLMVVVMLICAVPVVYGADIIDSGYCGGEGDGENLTWTLDSEGTLTISGTGTMQSFSQACVSHQSDIKSVIIENGVTSIGVGMFNNCNCFFSITIPVSVTRIEQCAFWDCGSLINVYYNGSIEEWDKIFIDYFNDALSNATIHFNSEGTETGEAFCLDGAYEFQGHYYKVVENALSWNAAQNWCSMMGGHLVTITTEQENDFIKTLLSSYPDGDYYIGINDFKNEGVWNYWVTGEPVSYSNWGKNEPDNAFGGQNAGTIVNGVRDGGSSYYCVAGQWDDVQDWRNNWFICEWDSDGPTGETTAETSTEFNTKHGKASVSLDIRDLEESAYDFNYYIARFAVNMSLLTYSPRSEISGCLSRLGFNFKGFPSKDTDEKDYCYWPDKKNSVYDKNCFVISRKDYVINGENKTLVLVMMRGTNGNEWYSNFNPGEGDTHASFDAGAKFVLNHLKNYMRSEGLLNKDNVKMIITGHSRGAAVANLLGKYINLDGANGTQKFGFPEEDNVFTYTFATPNVTSNPEATSNLFKTIFNFVNPEDFVTKVMPSKWEYKRYGVTLTLPSKTNDEYYHVFRDNMNVLFQKYKGKSYSPYSDGEETVYNLISKMTKKVESVYDFYHTKLNHRNLLKREPYLFFKEELCPLVSETANALEFASTISSLVYTWTAINADDLYKSIISFFFSKQFLGMLSDAVESLVNKIMDGEVDILNPLFEEAHFAETYAAFINTLTYDQMYTMGLKREGHKGSVNCPVDVEIIDKETNEVVGRIVDNVVDEEILAKENSVVMTVEGDEKSFWLPSNGDYEVRLIGNDTGTMDYTLAEIDSDTGELGRTNFFDVWLTNGLAYTAEVPAGDFILEEHTLTREDGEVITPDETFNEDDALEYTVTVDIEGNGTVEGAGTYTSGDYMTLTAIPDEYHVFAGWFVNGELTDEEAQLHGRLPAGTNINATARFAPHPHTYTSSVTTAPGCETSGVRTYTCKCGYSYTETVPASGHTAPDEHGDCARCGTHLKDVCPWCGGDHVGFFQGIIGFFHRIFAAIFGAKY